MFDGATAFDGNLSMWDISSVRRMDNMFNGATAFDSDLSMWDISSVTNMYNMFDGATSFNQNLCAWGDKAQYNSAKFAHMFSNSGCSFKDEYNCALRGPFCASHCLDSFQVSLFVGTFRSIILCLFCSTDLFALSSYSAVDQHVCSKESHFSQSNYDQPAC